MILPRFSIRWLLLLTAVCAVLSLIVASAREGAPWAIGMSAAMAGTVLFFLLFAAVFLISQWFALLGGLFRGRDAGQSPFADAGRPQQIIPPVEPE